jgi:iron complex transport system ATP-binding protein
MTMAASKNAITFRDLTLGYDRHPAVHHITGEVSQGELLAIVGPNGAGKSFLTKLLSHEERPLVLEDGSSPIRVFGSEMWDVFNLRSQLGIVSAEMHHRFVSGNNEGRVRGEAAVLSGFLASRGILRYGSITPEMRRRAADALALMGASHLADRWLDAMSSGEARRVLLARALVTSPRALVLDEPTTSLDLASRHDFMERVRQIARGGTTLILVTHHIEEIVPEIERIILLRNGRIMASGPKRAVLTADRLSELFEAPIALEEDDGYYYARPATVRS